MTGRDLLCFPLKFVVNFINTHLYYHATLDSWFLCVPSDNSGLVSQHFGQRLASVAAELCDLQAFPVSLQYETGFADLLKLSFCSGVERLFEADRIDDVKLPSDFLALN